MTRRKQWLIYSGIVCVMAAAAIIFLLTISSPYPDVDEPPAEANRVLHPAGFSIIRPGRTRATIEPASPAGDDQITIRPDAGRSRYTPVLSVRRLRDLPERSRLEHDGFQPGTFQGQDALVYKGSSGKYDAYRVLTNRGGSWYEIALLIPGGESTAGSLPSPEWQRYLNTFAPAPPASATTRPSGEAT